MSSEGDYIIKDTPITALYCLFRRPGRRERAFELSVQRGLFAPGADMFCLDSALCAQRQQREHWGRGSNRHSHNNQGAKRVNNSSSRLTIASVDPGAP